MYYSTERDEQFIITPEVVERAAIALWEAEKIEVAAMLKEMSYDFTNPYTSTWRAQSGKFKNKFRVEAERALRAALEIEDHIPWVGKRSVVPYESRA